MLLSSRYTAEKVEQQRKLGLSRVLLVEDSAFIRKLIRNLLTGIGITQVLEVSDGAEALSCVKTFEPDLILLDLEMPRISGPQFVRMVRMDPEFRSILSRTIILTGYAYRSNVEYAKKYEVGGFVMKPLSAKVLRDHIVSVIAKADLGKSGNDKVQLLPV